MKFDTREEAVAETKRVLASRVPAYMVESIADQLSPVPVDEWPEVIPGAAQMLIPRRRWAIRDEDLSALSNLGAIAGTIVSCGALSAVPLAQAAVVALAVLPLWNSVKSKGIRLSGDECAVLMALQMYRKPLTYDEIKRVLFATGKDAVAARLEAILKRLSAIARSDGVVVALVNADAEHRWTAAGV